MTQTVTCACGHLVFLKRKRTPRRNVVLFGGVCEGCGRGMDLWMEKQPGNEVRAVTREEKRLHEALAVAYEELRAEQKRADAAEAQRDAARDFANATREALAAARRECEGLKAMLIGIVGQDNYEELQSAALAAPAAAAGEEKPR